MCVFYIFKIVKMAPNRAKHHILIEIPDKDPVKNVSNKLIH